MNIQPNNNSVPVSGNVSTGEKTGKQAMMFQPSNGNIVAGVVGVVGPGYGGEIGVDGVRHRSDGLYRQMHVNGLPLAWPGQYPYFRRVLMDPSVRFVRAIAYAPILTSEWSWTADKDAPGEAMELMQKMFDPLRLFFMDDAVRSIDYGWAPFEKIFSMRDGMFWFDRAKPLLPETTSIMVTDGGDTFAGFSNNGADLSAAKGLLLTYDGEAGNLYGRGRVRNLMDVMPWWNEANEGAAQYDRKVAGVFLVCHYPPGTSIDVNGKEVDNADIAQKMLDAICAGNPIALCNEFAGETLSFGDMLKDFTTADRTRWKLEILEDRGSRQPGFTERLTYLDKLKARGWLVPERAAFEAQRSGSRADSESMGDVVTTQGMVEAWRIAKQLEGMPADPNSAFNTVLRMNWGPKAMGTVHVRPTEIEDDKKKFLRDVCKEYLSGFPQALGKASSIVKSFQQAGLPMPSEPIEDEALNVMMEDMVAMKLPNSEKQNLPPEPKTAQATLSRIYDHINAGKFTRFALSRGAREGIKKVMALAAAGK